MTGKFITFEGIEGCGKTTQINMLREYLVSKKYEVIVTREPGGTKIGDQIRKILLLSENKEMYPIAELLLYAAQRNQHIEEKIKPAINSGKIILCDRYADATTAYQGAARKIDREILIQIHKIATEGLKPDLTLLFDCPVEIGLKRALARNKIENLCGKEDRFEMEKVDFHNKVREGYLEIQQNEPNRVIIIDATQSIDKMHADVVRVISEKLI